MKSAMREKALRMRSGWRYDWYDPRSDQTIVIQEVIRGSFVSPQLVAASPFVFIASGERSCESTSSCVQIGKPLKGSCRCANLRRGIPDPWAEYLTLRGVREASARVCPQEVNLWADNLFLTESMWQKWGLPFGQGIPDPWRNWPKIVGWRSKRARKKIANKGKEDIRDRSTKRTGEECTCASKSRSPNESPQPMKEVSSSASESCGTEVCPQNLKMNTKPDVNRNRGEKQTCESCKRDSPCGPIRKQQESLRPKRQPLCTPCERVYKKNVPNKNEICNKNCGSPLTAMASNEFRLPNVRTKYASIPGAIHFTYSRETQSICPKNDKVESNRTCKAEPNWSALLTRDDKLRAKSSSAESLSPSPATRKKKVRVCARKLNNMPEKCTCTSVLGNRKNNSTEIYKCKCQCSRKECCEKLYKCVSPENSKRSGSMTVKCTDRVARLADKPHTVTCCSCNCPGKKDLRDFETCIERDSTLQANDRISSRLANRKQATLYCSGQNSSCPRTQRIPIRRAQACCPYCKYEYKEKQGTALTLDKIDLKCNICHCTGVVCNKMKRVNYKNAQFNDDPRQGKYLYEHGIYPKYKLSACTYRKKARCRLWSYQWGNKGKGKKKRHGKKGKGKGKVKRKKKNNNTLSGNRRSLSPGTYYRLVRDGWSPLRLSEDHAERAYRHRELQRPAYGHTCLDSTRNIDVKCQFCGCSITEYEGNHVPENHVKIALPLRNELREGPCHNNPARASEGLNGKPQNIVLRNKRKRNRDESRYLHNTDSGEMGDVSTLTLMSHLTTERDRSGGKYEPLIPSSRFVDKNTSPQLAQEAYIESINSLRDHRKKCAQEKYYMKEINNSNWSNCHSEETCPRKKPVDTHARSSQVMWKAPEHNTESEEHTTFLNTNRVLVMQNEENLKVDEAREARPSYLKPSNFVMPHNIPLSCREMNQNDDMFLNRKSIASTSRNMCGELKYQAADSRTFGTGNSSVRGQRLPDTYSRNGRHNICDYLPEGLRENNIAPVDSTTFGEWVENYFSNQEKELKHYHYEEVPGEDTTKIQSTGNYFPAKETIASYLTVNYKSQDPSSIPTDKENRMNLSSLQIKNKTLPESVEDNATKTWPELQVQCGVPRVGTAEPFLRGKENDKSKWNTNTCTNLVQRGFTNEENVKHSAQENKYFSSFLDEPGKKIILHTEPQSIGNKGTHNLQQPYECVTSLNGKGNGDELSSRKKVKEYQTLRRENEDVQETSIFFQSVPLYNEPVSKIIDTDKQPKYKGSKLEEVLPESSSPLARKLTKIYPSRAIGDNVIKYREVVHEDRVSKFEDRKLVSLPPNEGNEMVAVKFNSFVNEFRTSNGNRLSHLRVIRPVDVSPELQCKKVIRRNFHGNINDPDAFLLEQSSVQEKNSTENNSVDNISIHRRILTSCSAPPPSSISTRNCNEIADEFSSAKQRVLKRETSNSSSKPRTEKRMLTFLACGIKDDTKFLVSEMDERKQEAVTEQTLSGRKGNSPETREVEEELMNFDVLDVSNKDRRDHLKTANSESEGERPHSSGASPRKNISKNIKMKAITPESTTGVRSLETTEVEEEIRSVDLDKVAGTAHREDRTYPPTSPASVQEVVNADQGLHLTRKKNKARARKLERTVSGHTTDIEEGTAETDKSSLYFIHPESKHSLLNKSASLSSGAEQYDKPHKEARVRKYGVLRPSAKFTSPPGIYNSPIPGLPSAEEFEPAVPSSEETIIKNIVYE